MNTMLVLRVTADCNVVVFEKVNNIPDGVCQNPSEKCQKIYD